MYMIAGEHQEGYDTIPKSMWFAIVTLTTVGYGDKFPITTEGKLVASIAIILGVVILTSPVVVMSTKFRKQ
jgi:voltage-gated potassium channel